MAPCTPQVLAIAKIEMAEEFTPEETVNAAECLMRDPDLANMYLALSNPDLGAAIIRRGIKKFRGTVTPQALAIAKIEKAEGFAPEEIVNAAECLMRDPDLANMYLALSNPDLGAAVIRREVKKFRSR